MKSPLVISIFGPTAVGKSATGVSVRQKLQERGFPTLGISADAYAVYREIPIITGAGDLDAEEWLTVGSISVRDEWSAGAFSEIAKPAIDQALSQGTTPVLVGGTGLYLQAALTDMNMRQPVPEDVRQRISDRLSEIGVEGLHAELAEVSPETATAINSTDTQRVTRALESIEVGETPNPTGSIWTADTRHPTLLIGLTMDRERLRKRIDARIDTMLKAGAASEVAAAQALGPSRTAQAAIGMAEIPTMQIDQMRVRTHRFAKRQETWMRKLENAVLIDMTESTPQDAADQILEKLDNSPSA